MSGVSGSRPYDGTSRGLANSVNAGDLSGPLSRPPAHLRPDFTVLVTHGLTDAWQTVLWASAVVCAVLSVAIYVLLGGRPAGAG
ncbi:hypothetical protein ACFW1M_30835 [Streptomyces inhibens]|uniref:hypothetical protein n=1 Tax=Streptomyces inhibens TaxID=2293571 RepID=UPI0036BB4050